MDVEMASEKAAESISKIAIGEAQPKVERTPSDLIAPPQTSRSYVVDKNIIAAFPVPGAKIIHALDYGESLWGKTAKIIVRLPSGEIDNYFLKVVNLGATGRHMCEGEFESLQAIYAVSPGFVPKPYAWGKFSQAEDICFLLAEFRDVGEQVCTSTVDFTRIGRDSTPLVQMMHQGPAEPAMLATRLAELHEKSVSPTGKFGFHIATCHAKISQAVNYWENSWCALYSKHLRHVMALAKPMLDWPEFEVVCKLTLDKVVPRLLLPLQSHGRTLKPCLVHGNCWDGNTAMDMRTGEAFVFDVCSFYGHNEYDTGNWRAPRHKLSNKAYIKNYKRNFPVSEPEEDWDARNLLYSLTFNIGNAMYIPGSSQRQVVYDDMTTLCKMFCPEDLKQELKKIQVGEFITKDNDQAVAEANHKQGEEESGKEKEEEEEEEEEEEGEEE